MNDILSNGVHDDIQHDDMDRVLRGYFRRQMPNPWPAAKATALAQPTPRRRSWLSSYGRLALAASILLGVMGYLALSSLFPEQEGPGLNLDRTIGSKQRITPLKAQPLPTQRERTANGVEVESSGWIIPGKGTIINVKQR